MASTAQQAAAPGVRASQMFIGDAVANAVNMFRGEVNLPVDLVTLGGRNGLDVKVSAFYSSGVHRAAQRWNLTEPTDVLGLGWSMPYERIMVEHQDSGTNLDDVFYLVTGGSPKQLVRVGVEGAAQVFQLRDHQFWHIRYFPAADSGGEYWQIVREDGTTYTYGPGAVQWGVRWGNWIGPSTVGNGVSFPVAWNLHEVRSMAGDTMSFAYTTDDVPIGTGAGALYTRSCRLRQIVDVFGRTVDFTYLPKEPFEAPAPQVPPPGGRNAYQYRLEDHYLDRIDVLDPDGAVLLTTRLDYRLGNVSGSPKDNAYTKRYLAGVRQEVPDGDSAALPGVEFDYHGAGAPLPGALQSVLTPQGGRATYAYKAVELPNTTLRVPITSPGAGWTPRVWHGPTYTVVTWENSATGRVTTGVYSWNGSWTSQQDTHEWPVTAGTLRVLTGDGFFATWYRDARSQQYRVHVVRQDEFRFGEWDRAAYQVGLGRPMTDPAVSVGAGFLAVADAAAGQLKILSWDPVGSRWQEHSFGLADVAQVALSSGVNFCVATTYASTGRKLTTTIYYGDPGQRWLRGDTVSETVDIDWEATRRENMLATGASFAALGFVTAIDEPSKSVRYATRLLTWSPAYRFGTPVKAGGTQALDVRNPVGYVVSNGSTVGNGQHLFRFDGARWQTVATVTPVAGPRYTYSYAADAAYATTVQPDGRWTSDLYEFDPYGSAWRSKARPSGSARELPTLAGGGEYRTAGRELLRRTPDGTWAKVHTLPSNADLTTVVNAAPAYVAYQDSGGSTHVLTLADGGVLETKALSGERVVVPDAQPGQILTGPGTFVTYRGTDFDKSQLTLYRVVGAAVATRLVAYPVVQVGSDTGFQTQHTTLDYDAATATYDPYGLVTQYVSVRSTPGDGENGWVERVFFNGLRPTVSGVVYPPSGKYSNARSYFSRLNGQLFRTRAYDADGRQVSESVSYPYTYTSGERIAGAYTRVRRQTEATAGQLLSFTLAEVADLDSRVAPTALREQLSAAGLALPGRLTVAVERPGRRWTLTDATGTPYQIVADGTDVIVYGWLEAAAEYEYNAKGQPCLELTENIDDSGVTRRLSTTTVYAWQTYQHLADLNCLVPVSQVTTADLTADVVTGSTVTTYSNAWGPWAAHRAYEWRGTGTPDFADWEPGADPGPDWLRARQVLAVTERAQPLAALDAGDHIAAVIYDRERRFAVATTASADPRADEASYYGFEEYEDADGWTLTPPDVDPADHINEGPAHSGSRRLAIPGDPDTAVGITNTLTPARGDRSYQLSCWVCTEPGFVSGSDLAAWQITVRGENRTAEIVTAIPATGDQWSWMHQLIDPRALDVGTIQSVTLTLTSRQDHRYLLVDDIAFAPVQGSLSASVCSPDGQELRGTVDILGDSRRIAYDLLQRPVVEIGPDGSPLSMSADQLWRSDRDSFDPERPNGSLMVALRGQGSFTDFRQGSQWQAQWKPSSGWRQTPGLLRHESTGSGTLTLRQVPHGSYLLRFGLAGDPPVTGPLRLTFGGGWSVRWTEGTWSLHQPDSTEVTSADGPAGTDLLLVAWPHRVLWYVDGRLMLQRLDSDGFVGPLELACDGALTVRWIALGGDPVGGVSWIDNAGRPYQLQLIDGTRLRVSATAYDDAGRAAVSTKCIEVDGEPVGYRDDLVTALDPATGAMGDCELTRAHPGDEGYPFSRTVFEASPLGRPIEAGLPGKAFAVDTSKPVGDRHTTRTEYRINTDEPLLPDLPAGTYPVTVTIGPDGHTTQGWTDRLGRILATAQGDLAGAPGTFTLARDFRDPYGNVVRSEQPNLVDTRVSDRERFVARTEYDFLGNPLSFTGPDLDGSAEYVYDTLGRLRFSRLPQSAAEGCLSYRAYDSLGRLLEEGTCDATWDRDQLQAHADDREWLPAPGTWLSRYRYDGDGSDPRLYGRLWQTWSGPASGGAPATRTTFAYNELGLVTSRAVSVAAYADGAPHTVAFRYDATGAVTDITYDAQRGPDAFTATMRADGFGDLVGVTGNHDGRSTDLARFAYTPDGALAEEVLAPGGRAELTRGYSYTPPGWLASVSDRYLTETTDYTTGGLDGAGYHDGRAARVTTGFTGVDQTGFVPDFDYRYGYDALGRLAAAESDAGEEYGVSGLDYDANGNLVARTVGDVAQQLRYGEGTNQLHAIDDGVETDPFGYDRDGDITDAPLLGVSDLRYEQVTGLPAGLSSAAGALRLERDPAGTLLYRAGPDGQRLYVPGGAGPLALHHTDASGAHRFGYLVPGPGGTLAVWSPEGTAYVLRGRLGSTRALYNGSGLVGAFNYLPYGGFLGTPLDRGATAIYPYLFTGAEHDPSTGLYLFPKRLYDPSTGRFLSTDPAGQYPSPYLYAGGDPVNGFDPSGAFTWSWAAFGAVVGGIAALAGGILLTVATGGLALGWMVLGAVAGGALIGGGISSAAYGFGHAGKSTSRFDWAEWGIMVGLGAAFGAASAGIGFAAGAVANSAALALETVIGTGMGALDGYLTNGSLNAYQGNGFNEGAVNALWQGALGGAVGGAIGGALGRGPMLRTNRAVRAGRSADPAGDVFMSRSKWGYFGHLRVSTRLPGEELARTTELGFADQAGTRARISSGIFDPGRPGTQYRRLSLPANNVGRAEALALLAVEESRITPLNNLPAYSKLNNNCTTYARKVLRDAGIHPPLWALTPNSMDFWMRTIGARRVVVPGELIIS